MIFCAFLDPESVRKLSGMGVLGMDSLIGILRALLENCLLAETTDWQTGTELKAAVQAIPDQTARMKATALLESFWKRDRFASILDTSNATIDASPAQVALTNRSHHGLDVIVTETPAPHPAGTAEVTAIEAFHSSDFAANRQRMACGIILNEGQMDAADFFKRYLSRLHLVTTKFEVWDYMIGQQFGENYFCCLKWWVGFLSEADEQVEFVIHTEGNQFHAIQQRLDSLCEGTCISPSVKQHDHLPHERYLLTKAFDFDLGRGIDLFNPTTGRNRDIRVAISPRLRI